MAGGSDSSAGAPGRIDANAPDPVPGPSCPRCGRTDRVVPIVYGLPGPDARLASARGEISLGGCVMSSDAPEWHCLRCNFDLPPGDRPPTTRWGALGLPDTRAQSVDDARALLRR